MAHGTGSHVNISSYAKEEHDGVTYRHRMATHIDGNTVAYEDTNFTSGESSAVFDVITDLGRLGLKGYFINDGPGRIKIEVSHDGTNYGGLHTLRGGEQFDLSDLKINRIRVTYVEPTGYRAQVG